MGLVGWGGMGWIGITRRDMIITLTISVPISQAREAQAQRDEAVEAADGAWRQLESVLTGVDPNDGGGGAIPCAKAIRPHERKPFGLLWQLFPTRVPQRSLRTRRHMSDE